MLLDDILNEHELDTPCQIVATPTPRLSKKSPKPPNIEHPKPVCIVSSRENLKRFTYDISEFSSSINPTKNLIFPCDIDTEYTQPVVSEFLDGSEHIPTRLNLSVQVKHPLYTGEIFLHSDLTDKPLPSYTPVNPDNLPDWGFIEDVAFVDYLKRLGFEVDLIADYTPDKKDIRPVFIFKLYAHFLIADISSIGGEFWHDVVRTLYINDRLTMDRRATIQSGDFKPPYFTLPDNVNINVQGIDYKLGVQIIDTIALMGNESLSGMASNVGLVLESKNDLDHLKTRMDIALYEHPEIFKKYALGDLVIYEIVSLWNNSVKTVYESLEIEEHFKQPALTMGSTVAGVCESRLRSLLDCPKPPNPKDDMFYELLGTNCTSEHLAGCTTGENSGLHLLSKIGGGRAFNNSPIVANLKEACIDMDLGGAYSSVMQSQPFPIGGLPVLMNFRKKEHPTLREFLTRWNNELINGLWLAVISTPLNFELSLGQDYLRSWQPANIKKEDKGRINPKHGETKYFSHEFFNAQFTSFDLTWLNDDISPRLKNEILDNVIVNSAIVYPKSLLLDNVDLLHTEKSERVFKWNIKDKDFILKGKPFYKTTMGELAINELQAWREINPKKGTPEQKLKNTLFKLFVNTFYGIAVSPFFKTANTVVGNNITAAVRRGAWCLEKGCNGQQSITDGGIFPVNRVLYKRLKRNFSPLVLFKTYEITATELNRFHAKLKPLLDGHIEFKNTLDGLKTIIDGLEHDFSDKVFNERTLEHLQNTFPTEPLFNQITPDLVAIENNGKPVIEWKERKGVLKFEMKTPVIQTTLHGTANYKLIKPCGGNVLKMRSYTSKNHYGFELIDNVLEHTDIYDNETVAEYFHNQLMNNPHNMTLPPPYVIEKILKPKDYAKTPDKWHNGKDDKSFPSWNVLKVGLLRPCTLSQFQFRTQKQWKEWNRQSETLKRKYGYSFELFFINDDMTLNYQLMIKTLDRLISDGELNPLKKLSKHYKNFKYPVLSTFTAWQLLRERVRKFQEFDLAELLDNDDIDLDDFESLYEQAMKNEY